MTRNPLGEHRTRREEKDEARNLIEEMQRNLDEAQNFCYEVERKLNRSLFRNTSKLSTRNEDVHSLK